MQVAAQNQRTRDLPLPGNAAQLDELRAMTKKQLKSRFCDLIAPDMAEMKGEFQSVLLDQGNQAAAILIRMLFNWRGRWTGKAFHPVSDSEGHGYNSFRGRGAPQRRMRMQTMMGTSALDDDQSFILVYRQFNSGIVGTMVDEVRRVCPGLYLGFGDVALSQRFRIRRKIFFALTGPVAEFRHDI